MTSTTSRHGTLSARVERFEGMYAILIGPQLSEFRWPIQELPSDVNVGDTVVLQLVDDKHEEEQKFEQMRKLLEELIN